MTIEYTEHNFRLYINNISFPHIFMNTEIDLYAVYSLVVRMFDRLKRRQIVIFLLEQHRLFVATCLIAQLIIRLLKRRGIFRC